MKGSAASNPRLPIFWKKNKPFYYKTFFSGQYDSGTNKLCLPDRSPYFPSRKIPLLHQQMIERVAQLALGVWKCSSLVVPEHQVVMVVETVETNDHL